MDRAQNLNALAAIAAARNSAGKASLQTMANLRRAAYLHQIVECMLSEQVSMLPDSYSTNPI